jgi:hypothetical protein
VWSSLIFAERDDLEIELRAVQADLVGLQRRMHDAQQALAMARPLISFELFCGGFVQRGCELSHREVVALFRP